MSISAASITSTASSFISQETSIASHLATAAALLQSASAIASTLASSHPPTATSSTQPASTSASAPAPPRTTSWYSAPNTRGTWDLLITCLITINLCVWTAVHLNIQPKLDQPQPLRKRLWNNYYCRRARWVLLGLLAPELVVYTAWMQWESARVFAKQTGTTLTHGFYAGMGAYCIEPEVDIASCDEEHGPSQLYRSMYTDCEDRTRGLKRVIPGAHHSQRSEGGATPLYASMLQNSDSNTKSRSANVHKVDPFSDATPYSWPRFYLTATKSRSVNVHEVDPFSDATPYSWPRLYLTAEGVYPLVKDGKLSLPNKGDIAERSKSDLLAKTLVCLQAGYIIVQCVSRLASSLPLTFLEINTLGHVLCALIMYSFWLHKPQDLSLSITLEPNIARQLRTWHRCSRHIRYMRNFCDVYKVVWERAKAREYFEVLGTQSPSSTSLQATQVQARKPAVFDGLPTESNVSSLTGEDCLLVIKVYLYDEYKDDLHMILREDKMNIWSLFTKIYLTNAHDDDGDYEPIPEYIRSTSRVACFDSFGDLIRRFEFPLRELLDVKAEPINYRDWYLQEEIQNWPSDGLLSGRTYLPAVAIALSTALYGGLHAAAWHSFFPSLVEKWLWRVSSIIIAGSGMIFALGGVAYRLWLICPDGHDLLMGRMTYSLLIRVLDIVRIRFEDLKYHSKTKKGVLGCLGVISVISRMYLVVEAFVSLRKVPIEVYQTPDWTQWIPHL